MNPHKTNAIKVGTTLVGLTLAVTLAGLGCSDSGGDSPTGKGGTTGTAGKGGTTGSAGTTGTAGKGGTTGSAGTTGVAGTTGTAGTGGSIGGTGGATAGTTGSGGSAGTGGSTGGTGGMAGSNSAGTGGSATGGAGTTGSGGTGGTGGSGGTGLPANLPPTLNPPAGATLKVRVHATGDQIYTCTASSAAGTSGTGTGGTGGAATTYAYVLKQPDAKLWDWDNTTTQVGTHGLGPNWTSTDGSVVNGAKAYGENATGTIQWLLLRATSNTGTGVFGDVTYVIRANTTGGVAPSTGCDSNTAGTDTRIAYTADYYFYSGGGAGAAWLTPPANLPTAIQVPSGATVKLHDHAIGWQVYTCTASTGGTSGTGTGGAGGTGGGAATTYSWVLKQPDAMLYDSSFAQVGTHGAGPNWTSTDLSVVNGARVAGANSTMTGAIQWLLLMATSNAGTGVFSDVTFIQRLNTAGGPATGTCDAGTTGTETRIPYSADYYFFTGGVAVDGGTNG